MKHFILEKARPHKYIKREGSKGQWVYTYQQAAKRSETEIRNDIKSGNIPHLRAVIIYRSVGSNEAVVDIDGVKFLLDHVVRLKAAGISTDYSKRKSQFPNKTEGEVNDWLKKFPKLGKDDFQKKEAEIELAPEGTERIEKYRKEAKERLEEWREKGLYSDEQILWEGYKWRHWARSKERALEHGWEWAMWEEIQKFAKEKNFKYKEKLTKQEMLDNPLIPDVDKALGSYSFDDETTEWRNHPNRGRMWEFINSHTGQNWKMLSQRDLWGQVKGMEDEEIKRFFPGLMGLKRANSWDEALNTEIDIYRGVPEEKEKPYGRRNFVSYTIVPAIADKFARGYYYSFDKGEGEGIVVKRRIKLGDVLGFVNNDGENEVLVRPPKQREHVVLEGAERIVYERRDKSK